MPESTPCLHFAWRTTSLRVGCRAARRSCLPGLRRGGGGRQAGATVLSCLVWRCEIALTSLSTSMRHWWCAAASLSNDLDRQLASRASLWECCCCHAAADRSTSVWYNISVCNQPNRSTQPCIPPGSLNRVPALLGGGEVKGGSVTSAGWQVTLRDPIWHVSSRSGEANSYIPYFT